MRFGIVLCLVVGCGSSAKKEAADPHKAEREAAAARAKAIAGAWRIPPDAEHTWQRATWTVNAGKAMFVPDGWRVRVRLGR